MKEANKSPREFWAYMKQKTSNKQLVRPLQNKEDRIVNENEEQANIIN